MSRVQKDRTRNVALAALVAGAPLLAFACGGSGATSTGAGGAGSSSSSAGTSTSSGSSSSTGAGGASGASSSSSGGMVCKPGEVSCDGMSAVQTCKADGSGYDIMQCQNGTQCSMGKCACVAGQQYCNGATIQTCGMDGMLHDLQTCPMGTTCRDGLCDDLRCPDELGGAVGVSLPTSGWPRYRHDNRSSGWTHAVVPAAPALKWKVFVGGAQQLGQQGLASGPVVNQNDILFITAGNGDMKGGLFDSFDSMGKPNYVFMGPSGYGYTTPAVRQDGTAYYSTADGHAYAVKPDGTQLWQYTFGFQNDCSPIVTKDGNVIYGSDSGSLFALQSQGSLLWQSDPASGPGEVDSALAESCDGVIYAGGRNGWTTLDALTGKTVWQVAATGSYAALMSSPTVAADGTMYGIDSGGTGYAIDKTGKVLWQASLGPAGPATDFAHVGDKLFAVLNDGSLHAFDTATGAPSWSKPVGHMPEIFRHAGPIVDGNMHLYFASDDGNLYAFDTMGNQLWKLPVSGVAQSGNSYGTPAIGKDGTIYVPGNDGYLYAFH